jgi:uncharacterized protein YuzE
MKEPYLEVTFRHGHPIAAYLYLPRQSGDTSCRTLKIDPGMIIDFNRNDQPIGIEITAPGMTTAVEINQVLKKLGLPELEVKELAPLKAA